MVGPKAEVAVLLDWVEQPLVWLNVKALKCVLGRFIVLQGHVFAAKVALDASCLVALVEDPAEEP